MKKAAIILGSISLGAAALLMLFYAFAFFEIGSDAGTGTGWTLLLITIAYVGLGLFLLIYTALNVDSYNQVKLGVLILLFVCVPAGILIICLPRYEGQMHRNNYGGKSNFEKIMMEKREEDKYKPQGGNGEYKANEYSDAKCSKCSRQLNSRSRYIVIIDGKKVALCEQCLSVARKSRDNINVIKSPIK